ncbi:alpha/beta hydrolase-fold protein [Aeoliella sp. ICT_H6.2]|uniref:Alpha/beta hydrolase-fold protein n=1 Tax=Aeoliella straminimaris TaxID=2954799 RepID=A0A9X2FBY8_9BACT|nr:dienelactone hydrolase family protein [Aeoliella straminimaris]MCO6046095.1 alpha/beta hydrolase-fold protein [Aeoliella straminimaris]
MPTRLLAFAVCFAACPLLLADDLQPMPGEQIATRLQVTIEGDTPREVEVPFLLYVPEDYQATGKPWPLVLFLHGAGERGDGSEEQLPNVAKHGPPKQVAAGRQFPFILVSPQCSYAERNVPRGWQADQLQALLDKLEKELNVDTNREYLTGLSMGGFGSWRLATAAPERFAAVAPICGSGNPQEVAALVDVPLWAFHGAKDPVVKLESTTNCIDALREAGGHPRLTVYPEAMHDSWTETYDNPMFYEWLLGERLGE